MSPTRRILLFLACALTLTLCAVALSGSHAAGVSSAASRRPPSTSAVSAQTRAVASAARVFTVGYLRYTAGCHSVPADATRGLRRRLRAHPPLLCGVQGMRHPRLTGLTVSTDGGLQAQAIVADGEGIRYRLLLRLAEIGGRPLVSRVREAMR